MSPPLNRNSSPSPRSKPDLNDPHAEPPWPSRKKKGTETGGKQLARTHTRRAASPLACLPTWRGAGSRSDIHSTYDIYMRWPGLLCDAWTTKAGYSHHKSFFFYSFLWVSQRQMLLRARRVRMDTVCSVDTSSTRGTYHASYPDDMRARTYSRRQLISLGQHLLDRNGVATWAELRPSATALGFPVAGPVSPSQLRTRTRTRSECLRARLPLRAGAEEGAAGFAACRTAECVCARVRIRLVTRRLRVFRVRGRIGSGDHADIHSCRRPGSQSAGRKEKGCAVTLSHSRGRCGQW